MSETIRDQAGDERRAEIARRMTMMGPPKRGSDPKPFRAKPKPEGYVFGRPTLYRPEYCQRVIECMSQGFDLSAFAGTVNASRMSVYRWIDEHTDFRDAVNIGRSKRLYMLQEKLLTTKMGVGVTAAIFALKNAAPDEWQDRFNTQTEVNVRIERIPDARLLEIVQSAPKQIAPAIASKPEQDE